MGIQNLSFLLGALLLLVALFGTGLEIKEFRIARASTATRIISSLLGLIFIGIGFLLFLLDRPEVFEHVLDKPDSETPTKTIPAEQPPAPAVEATVAAQKPAKAVKAPPEKPVKKKPPAPADEPKTPPPVVRMAEPVATPEPPTGKPLSKPAEPATSAPLTKPAPMPSPPAEVVPTPAPKDAIGTLDELPLDAGFELETRQLGAWNIGEKHEGRQGIGGFQKVYHELSNGADRSRRSLAMKFRLGTERSGKHWRSDMRARIKYTKDRDLQSFKGVRLKVRSDSNITIQFALWEKPHDAYNREVWRTNIHATPEWRDVRISFDELILSESWTDNEKLDLEDVIALTWTVNEKILPAGKAGVIWIDDVSFYR